jgi:hypothetical protein
MSTTTASPKSVLRIAVVTFGLVGASLVLTPLTAVSSTLETSVHGAAASNMHSDAATTTTTTTPSDAGTVAGLITAGPSRSQCVTPNVKGTGLAALQSAVTQFDAVTHTSVSCLSAYLNGTPTWTAWEHPWITEAQYGYTSWVSQAPLSRELVLQVDLIPTVLKNIKNPISWERSCAAGDFSDHATDLGRSLVAAGLQHSVIRLGAEMNGTWETDFVGNTAAEHELWVKCFRNEVVGLRHAVGQHFLIDWNPNPCQYNVPYFPLYPGNSFVNIIGIDLFDQSCAAPTVPYSFDRLANEPAGLTGFEAFARTHHKPLSLPEWGLAKKPSGDDPNFINGIGSVFTSDDYAFETYFDVPGTKGTALPLGANTPLSLTAFQRWFAGGAKP